MEITPKLIKELREKTGAGVADCKKALVDANGNLDAAFQALRAKGLAQAAKRSGRKTRQGFIGSYIHDGRIGVMVELNCETDFVAKTDDFKNLLKKLCLHITASETMYMSEDKIPADILSNEIKVTRESLVASGKSGDDLEKEVTARIEVWKKQIALLQQPWFEDETRPVSEIVSEVGARTGENITIGRFSKFILGEEPAGKTE